MRTPKQSKMEGRAVGNRGAGAVLSVNNAGACIYRQRSPSSKDRYSQCQNREIATTLTPQTMSMTTNRSGSESSTLESPRFISSNVIVPSSSSPSANRTSAVIIETELSNLTETPSMEGLGRTGNFQRNFITAGDQLVANSLTRLHELELRRNVLRYQRFSLEQRLRNFRRIAFEPTTPPVEGNDNQEELSMVVTRRYKVNLNESKTKVGASETEKVRVGASSRCSASETVLYTGRLDTAGRPQDDNAILCFDDGQRYEGNVRNCQRHGSGVNRWPNGQVYEGEWRNGSRCGMGTHTWKDGRTVTGEWKDGHLNGRVFFRWPNGAIFDGNANMGKREGKGVSTRSDGTVYNGNYSNGKENGFGTLIHSNGVKYRGYFKDGLKEGLGVMISQTRTYDGEWSKDKPHGQGRVVWSNGAVFTGQFEQGIFSGLGVYIWPSGKKFVGRWENGVKNGHGLHTWPCGKKYDGHYANGHKDGYGRMTWADGSAYCGGFKRNKRYGRGIQTASDGTVLHCGLWKDDMPYFGSQTRLTLNPMSRRSPEAQMEMNSDKLLAEVEVPREAKRKNIPSFLSSPSEESSLPPSPVHAPAIVSPIVEDFRSLQFSPFRPIGANIAVANEHGTEGHHMSTPEDRQDATHRRSSPSVTLVSAFNERLSI